MNIGRFLKSKFVLFAGIFLLSIFAKLAYSTMVDIDSSSLFRIHESTAYNLLAGRGFLTEVSGNPGELAPLITYPPGFSVFIAIIYLLFDNSQYSIQMAQILIGSLGCVLFAQTVWWAFKNKYCGIASGIALAVIPIFTVQDLIPGINASLPLFFIILSLYNWYIAFMRDNRLFYILSGVSLGLAAMFRSETLLLIPIFALLPFLHKRSKLHFLKAACIFAGSLVVVTPWAVRNYRTFGAFSPSGPGVGLYFIEIIAKTYPDPENGFAFGDGPVLRAEGGEYTDLHWPHPYLRGQERLTRALSFAKSYPMKTLWAFLRNIPLAWFGHQLYISSGVGSFHTEVASGNLLSIIKYHPLAFFDRVLGLAISLCMFAFGFLGMFAERVNWRRLFPFSSIAFYYFIIFSFLGLLGRYTLPAYVMLIPFVCRYIFRKRFSAHAPEI